MLPGSASFSEMKQAWMHKSQNTGKNPLKSRTVLTLTSLKLRFHPESKIVEHSTIFHVLWVFLPSTNCFVLVSANFTNDRYEPWEARKELSGFKIFFNGLRAKKPSRIWGLGKERCPCLDGVNKQGCSFGLVIPSLTNTFSSTKCWAFLLCLYYFKQQMQDALGSWLLSLSHNKLILKTLANLLPCSNRIGHWRMRIYF